MVLLTINCNLETFEPCRLRREASYQLLWRAVGSLLPLLPGRLLALTEQASEREVVCLLLIVLSFPAPGDSVGSGHYTAYAAHEGRWFHFNDSTVTLTDEETVVKAKAYILFYVERQAKSGSDKL